MKNRAGEIKNTQHEQSKSLDMVEELSELQDGAAEITQNMAQETNG